MAHDRFDLNIPQPPQAEPQDFPETLTPAPAPAVPPRQSGSRVLLAGVAGACLLGAGLGLWARPADGERQVVARMARPQPAVRQAGQIQIVVDDSPAPIGPPMEVMRAAEGPLISLAPEPAPPPALAPVRPPAGLMRVLTAPTPLETADLPPAPRIAPRAALVVEPPPEPKKPVMRKATKPEPKAKAESKAKASDVHMAEAKKERAAKASRTAETKKAKAAAERKLAKAKVERDKAAKTRLAKAEPKAKVAKTSRIEKTRKEKLQLAKAEQSEKARKKKSAKSEGMSETKAKAPSRLAKAVKKAIKAPKAVVAEKSSKLKLAEASKAKAAKAKAEKARVQKAEAAPPRRQAQPVKGGGPLRMVSNRCASSDPAAALVCADPSLGAADRRLNRAYQQAEAAGVSANDLRRQQQRWLAARTAAAREAPWAVQDVYQARIAELEDMTRGANAGY